MIFLVGAILLTITRTVLAGTLNRHELLIMSAIYGYVRAATVVNQNLTISEYASEDKLAGALGLNMIAKGVFVMTIGQLLGEYWFRNNERVTIIAQINFVNSQVGYGTSLAATPCVYMLKMCYC